MSDWKEETNKRRNFRQCPDDEDSEFVVRAKKKKSSKDFALEVYCKQGWAFLKEGWNRHDFYKKQSDAEKAAEHLRRADALYKGFAFRIVNKEGKVLKEYPEIPEIQRAFTPIVFDSKLQKIFSSEKSKNGEENEKRVDLEKQVPESDSSALS